MRTDVTYQPSPQEVRTHLDQLRMSTAFTSAPRLRQFLTFVVEAALAGEEEQLKEYVIATSVYGRDPSYDPQIDSTVRVEASRLRRRLHDYYAGEGLNAPLQIQLPKGRYVPVFVGRLEDSSASTEPEIESAKLGEESGAAQASDSSGNRGNFALVAAAVVAVLALSNFAPPFKVLASAAGTQTQPSPEVLARYLTAQRLLRTNVLQAGWPGRVPPPVTEAIRAFEEVTRRDPGFALAWVGLAEAEEWAYELNGNQPAARLERALSALEHALKVNPQSGDAWSRLSSIYFHRYGNRTLAESAARKAVELNPKDLAAAARLVDLLRIRGRVDDAGKVLQRGLLLEPAAPRLWVQRALVAYDAGRYEEALGFAEHALGLFAGKAHPVGWWIKGLCLERMGRFAEAEKEYRAGMASAPVDFWNPAALGHLLARQGRTKEAEAILTSLHESSRRGVGLQYQIALVLTGLGRVDEAVAALERGRAAGDTSIAFVGLEKRFDRLRDQPGFRALIESSKHGSAGAG